MMNSKSTALALITSSILFAGCSSSESDSKNNEIIEESVTLPVVAVPVNTNINNASFSGASLSSAEPSNADLNSADPSIANPSSTGLSNADLSSDDLNNLVQQDETLTVDLDLGFTTSDQARYTVTIENFWGADGFPQDFPANAHLSLIGGATHNAAVSFWEAGELASPGIEDMAEAGLIDKLLNDEVTPAITNGTAGEFIEVREFTDPQVDGTPGALTFSLDMNIQWPLVSLTTMLGPSPDWFVGVSGLSLQIEGNWADELSVDMPLYDAGTKSDITPIMGGPDIIPGNPIGLVAYDTATGVYLATDEPQTMARLTFVRVE